MTCIGSLFSSVLPRLISRSSYLLSSTSTAISATTATKGDTFNSVPPQHIAVVGAPTPQQYHLLMGELARLLGLRLHESGRYYVRTDGSPGRYYPQINLSFYAEGRLAENGDPLQSTTFVLQSSNGVLSVQRRDDRTQPFPHTMLISAMGLTPNDNWTFRRESSPGITFHLQLDGSIWGSNGTTYSLNNNGTVREQENTQPLPFTLAFSQLGINPGQINLFPSRVTANNPGAGIYQGSFPAPGETGSYLIQEDGSIFYTGRTDSGGTVQPCTYIQAANGNWVQSNPPRRNPLPSTFDLARLNAYRLPSGVWIVPSAMNSSFNYSSSHQAYQFLRGAIEQYARSLGTTVGERDGYFYLVGQEERGYFYPQINGTFLRVSSTGNQSVVVSPESFEQYSAGSEHSRILPWTRAIAALGLRPYQPPNANSPFQWGFVNSSGHLFILQPDGTIWDTRRRPDEFPNSVNNGHWEGGYGYVYRWNESSQIFPNNSYVAVPNSGGLLRHRFDSGILYWSPLFAYANLHPVAHSNGGYSTTYLRGTNGRIGNGNHFLSRYQGYWSDGHMRQSYTSYIYFNGQPTFGQNNGGSPAQIYLYRDVMNSFGYAIGRSEREPITNQNGLCFVLPTGRIFSRITIDGNNVTQFFFNGVWCGLDAGIMRAQPPTSQEQVQINTLLNP